MSKISDALKRVEFGEAGVGEAAVLREALSLSVLRRVSDNVQAVQGRVLRAITDRGYRDGWNDSQFAARQIGKALEELAELSRFFDLPQTETWSYADCLQKAGMFARQTFDRPELWLDAGVDLERGLADLDEELADVLIPLLILAALLDIDILAVAERKARADIRRGVRR